MATTYNEHLSFLSKIGTETMQNFDKIRDIQ